MTNEDLERAIAKCNGKVDPMPDDAVLMAACLVIQDHLYPKNQFADAGNLAPPYSFAAPPEALQITEGPEAVGEYGDSDFLRAVAGRDPAAVWAVMDELMDTLMMVNRRVYDGVMRQIRKI